jgi:hypothetical protein
MLGARTESNKDELKFGVLDSSCRAHCRHAVGEDDRRLAHPMGAPRGLWLTLKFSSHVGLESDCRKRQTTRRLLNLRAVRWTVWD